MIGKLGRIPETGEIVRLGSAELEVVETAEQRVTSIELRVVGTDPSMEESTRDGKVASQDTD